MPRGKFFTLSPTAVVGCLVEVAGGSHQPGAEVVTFRPMGQAETPADHQLWWWDRPNNSIRSKLNNFCVTADQDGRITVQPFQSMNSRQRWRLDGMLIRSRDNEKVLGLAESDTHPGGCVYSQDADDAYSEEWSCQHTSAEYMHIQHVGTGKVLDVAYESCKPGASIIVYNEWPSMKDNQLWYEDEQGLIRSKMNDFVLTAAKGEITIQPYKPNEKSQQWVISHNSIVNLPDPTYVLDVSLPRFGFLQNIKDSFQVVPAEYNGSAEQRWEFFYAANSEATFGAPTSRYVQLRHETTGLLMTAIPLKTLGIPSDRTDIILETSKGEKCKEQQWLLDSSAKRIMSAVDGKCLDLSGNEVILQPMEAHSRTQSWRLVSMTIQNGADVDLFLGTSSGVLSPDSTGFNRVVARKPEAKSSPDLWKAIKAKASFFYIRSKTGDHVLDVKGEVKDSGGEVIIYERKPGPPADNQLWYEDEEGLLRSKINSYVCDSSGKTIKMRPYRHGDADQQWVIFGDVIKNQSKPDLCFDICRNRIKNGTSIIPYKFNNQENQKWILEYV